ncbi:hypothetical protein QNN01_22440 [Bradyrhizobium diazoefficiens]|nr:hypothetical protein [Bradyrhizobium diazoefficiens]WLA69708.1 hypothetical protein QNN01_22440 [Bradyrhizobium diazoefficiens]
MPDAMKCPNCQSEHAYQDRDLWVCPEADVADLGAALDDRG